MWFVINKFLLNALEINFTLFSNYKKASSKVKINDKEKKNIAMMCTSVGIDV